MIIVREGLPGGGKTLSAVGEDVLTAFIQGRTVVTNIWLDTVAIGKLLRKDVGDLYVHLDGDRREDDAKPAPFAVIEDFTEYEDRLDPMKRGPLYVIDECHEVLSTKTTWWKANGEAIVQWFARHRHKACDVTLITQDRMSIPVEVRRRCEFFYRYKKLAMLGFKGSYLKQTYHKDTEKPLRSDPGRYPKAWFGLYKSTLDRVKEKLPPVRNAFLTPKMILVWGVAATLVIYMVSVGMHLPGMGHKPVASAVASSSNTPGLVPSAAPAPLTPAAVKLQQRIQEAKLKAQLGLLDDGYVPTDSEGGSLIPGRSDAFGYTALPARKPRFDLDGYWVGISGYMMMNGQAVYFLAADRGGRHLNLRGTDLIQYGFDMTAITNCLAFIKSEDWGTYRLTCDAPVKLGGESALVKGAKLVEGGRDHTNLEQVAPK